MHFLLSNAIFFFQNFIAIILHDAQRKFGKRMCKKNKPLILYLYLPLLLIFMKFKKPIKVKDVKDSIERLKVGFDSFLLPKHVISNSTEASHFPRTINIAIS